MGNFGTFPSPYGVIFILTFTIKQPIIGEI